jgi:hypothetical protein
LVATATPPRSSFQIFQEFHGAGITSTDERAAVMLAR